MDFTNKLVRNQICFSANEVCKFLQGMTNITVISITDSRGTYTIFYY